MNWLLAAILAAHAVPCSPLETLEEFLKTQNREWMATAMSDEGEMRLYVNPEDRTWVWISVDNESPYKLACVISSGDKFNFEAIEPRGEDT